MKKENVIYVGKYLYTGFAISKDHGTSNFNKKKITPIEPHPFFDEQFSFRYDGHMYYGHYRNLSKIKKSVKPFPDLYVNFYRCGNREDHEAFLDKETADKRQGPYRKLGRAIRYVAANDKT
jgi:hypothetical protein